MLRMIALNSDTQLTRFQWNVSERRNLHRKQSSLQSKVHFFYHIDRFCVVNSTAVMETTVSGWPEPFDDFNTRFWTFYVLAVLLVVLGTSIVLGIASSIVQCQTENDRKKDAAKAKEAEEQKKKDAEKALKAQGNSKLKQTEVPKMEGWKATTAIKKDETQALKTVDGIDPTGINKFTEKFLYD
ncbi:hypothetical protein M3Y95_00501400 [Aphelenchoides besseyi]|nr:hypothetical protein M3Y95_00501400 [Aphelenchoides besseyi]